MSANQIRCLAAMLGGWMGLLSPHAVAQSPPLPLSALPLQLTGVMLDEKTPATSSCFIRCLNSDERHGALRVGDVACDQAVIKEIRENGVVIRNAAANRLEFLAFPPASTKPGAMPAPLPAPVSIPEAKSDEAARPTPPVIVDVPKAAVERYLSNISDLLQSALAVPHYAQDPNGQRTMAGFEVSRIKEGGAAEQVGLRNGDVVLEVNGQPLDSMSTVMALFGQVPTMTQARVTIMRGGQRIPLVINVK